MHFYETHNCICASLQTGQWAGHVNIIHAHKWFRWTKFSVTTPTHIIDWPRGVSNTLRMKHCLHSASKLTWLVEALSKPILSRHIIGWKVCLHPSVTIVSSCIEESQPTMTRYWLSCAPTQSPLGLTKQWWEKKYREKHYWTSQLLLIVYALLSSTTSKSFKSKWKTSQEEGPQLC